MKRVIRFDRVLMAAIVAAVAAWPLAQAAAARHPAPAVPGAIAVADGNKVFLVGHAIGVQIYACNLTPSGYHWGFVAPRADLYDDRGKRVTTHFAGPTWQAKDGSIVVGQVVDPRDSRRHRHSLAAAVGRIDGAWSERRTPHGHDLHPTDRNHGRPRPCRRRMQRGHGRDLGRGSLHRRLLLLEEDRRLIRRRRARGRSQAQRTVAGRAGPRALLIARRQGGHPRVDDLGGGLKRARPAQLRSGWPSATEPGGEGASRRRRRLPRQPRVSAPACRTRGARSAGRPPETTRGPPPQPAS